MNVVHVAEFKIGQFGLLFLDSSHLTLQHRFSLILLFGKWRAIQVTSVKLSETSNIATLKSY